MAPDDWWSAVHGNLGRKAPTAGAKSGGDRAPGGVPLEVIEEIAAPDAGGKERRGVVVSVPSWNNGTAAALERLPADFRIVVLKEPTPALGSLPPSTVVCVPHGPPARGRVAEPVAAHGSRAAIETERLARGRLEAPVELGVTAELAFAGGEPRFELLARELLFAQALADTMDGLAVALAAPAAPQAGADIIAALRGLCRRAEPFIRSEGATQGARDAFERVSDVASADDPRSLLLAAARLYAAPALLDDVYLLRALAERPEDAREVLGMQSSLAEAALPAGGSDLAVDRAIADEQLRFASLVPEPQRLGTARAAFQHFRGRFRKAYAAHHAAHWRETAKLHQRLEAATGRARALLRLNSLTELGPPVGEAVLASYDELLAATTPCEATADPSASGGCPECALRLDQQPPAEAVEETLDRLQRALGRQMSRLASVAVRQVLERSGDPRVERFLKVIQAAQLSSLVDILDDEMVGYLRRFLVEARLGAVLEPILSGLQQGAVPNDEEAREALREMARVIQRAFRGAQRSLPPGKPRGKGSRSP